MALIWGSHCNQLVGRWYRKLLERQWIITGSNRALNRSQSMVLFFKITGNEDNVVINVMEQVSPDRSAVCSSFNLRVHAKSMDRNCVSTVAKGKSRPATLQLLPRSVCHYVPFDIRPNTVFIFLCRPKQTIGIVELYLEAICDLVHSARCYFRRGGSIKPGRLAKFTKISPSADFQSA